jgi:cytidylate kinase
MGSVTIAATYGAGGSVVAPAVAERLGLRLVDRAIPVRLAGQLETVLTEEEEQPPGLVGRALLRALDLSGIFAGVPVPPGHLAPDERLAAAEESLQRLADEEGVVVLGRAAVFVLAGRTDTLHVRLDGPEAARRLQAMRHEGLDEAAAAAQQHETDRARAAYVRYLYPSERWDDPANYHLVLDSTAISLESCVHLIVVAARDMFARVEVAGAAGATA